MNKSNRAIVSVYVIAYNAASTILETLESIKAQTYQDIELVISDDCSKDNTIELCREWLKNNKDRFVRTDILTVQKNTGVSANCNRAEATCCGEWIKGIAGDDIMMPNCIADCVEYVEQHENTIALFGKVRVFGGSDEENKEMEANFDYYLLSLTKEDLLHHLLFKGNGLPAPGFFFHRSLLDKYKVLNDERVPMIDDWTRWINIIRAGIDIHFMDNDIVNYRIGTGVSTGKRPSLKYFESERLMRFCYLYPEWQKEDPDAAVKRIVKEECDLYQQLLESESDTETLLRKERNYYKEQYELYSKWYDTISHSKAYRIGKAILKPLKWLKKK